ncbi:hypothetical protein CDL12_23230 [Handroanthus impetiginosus]|uniref:Symplekin/Pta1 N-terminal domain-containing protein n=1 Tax=Handroanthus impetiginosus TaxID=429701 RepID=A0A2G9GGA8_9LAMI|nr:hypothetical protein CDL12_23230 [Handroanthus impetiginosus]
MALLDFSPPFEMAKGSHTVSIQYALRTALLGFLRCTHPVILESRERLLKELRAMNAGEAADQALRQIEKIMKKNERASRDLQLSKDDQLSNQLHAAGDVTKKRSVPLDNVDPNNSFDATSKRFRYGPENNTTATVDINDTRQDHVNGVSSKLPVLDGGLTPVEQMIAMIGALIAEGERGVESLEILISNIHPDLLADIVMTNMKHLPKNPPPLTRFSNVDRPSDSSTDPAQAVASNGFASSMQIVEPSAQVPASLSNTTGLPFSDVSTSSNLSTDSKRDPRRDPRRLDPRRMVVSVDVPPTTIVEDNANSVQYPAVRSDLGASISTAPPVLLPPPSISEDTSELLMSTPQTQLNLSESRIKLEAEQSIPEDEVPDVETNTITPDRETDSVFHLPPSPISKVEENVLHASMDVVMLDEAYSPSSQEADHPEISNVDAPEIVSTDLPALPPYIELAEDHQRHVRRLALERIINSYQNSERTEFKQIQIALVARLFAQADVSDVVGLVRKCIVSDYEQQKVWLFVSWLSFFCFS